MRLIEYLTQQSVKPADFARRIGVPSSTITRLLKGERGASLGLALRIERATGGLVAPSDLDRSADPSDAAPSSAA